MKKGELLAEIDAKDFEIQARTDSTEIARLATLLEQADRLVERQAKLVEKGFVSQNVVDDATAQRAARSTRRGARSEQARRNIGKAKVVAPLDGEIERQAVAEGDYVKVGDLLFTLVGTRVLRAQLPPAWQGAPRGLRGCAPR